MAKSKLGIHCIQTSSTDVLDYCQHAKPQVVTSMDHNPDVWRSVKAISSAIFIVGRYYLDDGEQIFLDDPEGRAQALFDAMRPSVETMRGIYDCWVSYNEPHIKAGDGFTVAQKADRLSRFHVKWGDLMRGIGIRTAAYNFSKGEPEPEDWQYLGEGLKHCDLLAAHEYACPKLQGSQPWLALRYRFARQGLPQEAWRDVVITELGLAGGTACDAPQDGWRFMCNEQNYLADLQWYETQLDDYVIGATIFSLDGWGRKGSFSIIGANAIRDYIGSTGYPVQYEWKDYAVTYPRETTNVPADPHLASFPRPVNDNGRGLHFILDASQQNIEGYGPWLAKMQMKWTTVLGDDENVTTNAAKWLLDQYGIYSVLRVYASGDYPKAPASWAGYVNKALQVGVPPYFQIFNEPEDGREGFNSPEHFASLWGPRAEAVVAAGGYCGLQVLSEEFLAPVLAGASDAVKRNLFFCLHNYGANHPPKYPYPDKTVFEDDTAVLRFIAIAKWFKDAWGFVPPMIGGEGGWLYQNHDDASLPMVDADKWKDWHLEMYDWFRTGVLSNGDALPDYLFSVCPWLLYASNWYSDSWVNGLDDDKKAALRDALANAAPYVRKFGGNVATPTVNFRFEPASVTAGETSTLLWDCENVKEVYTTWQGGGLRGVGGHGSDTIYTSTAGDFVFTLYVIYTDGSAHDYTATLTVTTPSGVEWVYCPPDSPLQNYHFLTITQGVKAKVAKIVFYDNIPADDPASEGGVELRAVVKDVNEHQSSGEAVTQRWPDGASTHYTRNGEAAFSMSGDSSFDPSRGESGPYTLEYQDAKVQGFGLPLRQHVEYLVKFTKE